EAERGDGDERRVEASPELSRRVDLGERLGDASQPRKRLGEVESRQRHARGIVEVLAQVDGALQVLYRIAVTGLLVAQRAEIVVDARLQKLVPRRTREADRTLIRTVVGVAVSLAGEAERLRDPGERQCA